MIFDKIFIKKIRTLCHQTTQINKMVLPRNLGVKKADK